MKPLDHPSNDSSQNIRLFSLIKGDHCGCAAKLGPWELTELLSSIPPAKNDHILTSYETWDDVGAIEWNGVNILHNVDIISPVVDDPYTFGKIAAANSLSDIYAKGGIPKCAMNILGYPFTTAPLDWAKDILRGSRDVLADTNIPLLGGHTVDNSEPLYGLSVIGEVSKNRFIHNSTLKVGDFLVITKPLGTGTIITGAKNNRNLVSSDELKKCISVMETTNRIASDVMVSLGVNACTDITGFGLLGHLAEMISPNNLTIELYFNNIPILDGVNNLIENGVISQGTHRNQDYLQLLKSHVEFNIPQSPLHSVLFDPQTSGGLLIGVEEEKAVILLRKLEIMGVHPTAIIGKVNGKSNEAKIIIK